VIYLSTYFLCTFKTEYTLSQARSGYAREGQRWSKRRHDLGKPERAISVMPRQIYWYNLRHYP